MDDERIRAHDGPADPEQVETGFEEGSDHKPDSPEEELEPDFARGVRQGPESDLAHKGRFSEGQEEFPDTPDKLVEGSFADGTEQIPRSDD